MLCDIASAEGLLDLAPALEHADALREATGVLYGGMEARRGRGTVPDATAGRINRGLMWFSRWRVGIDVTSVSPFDQDLAVIPPPLPGLRTASKLPALAPGTDADEFLHTRAVRKRNRVVIALARAARDARALTSSLEPR